MLFTHGLLLGFAGSCFGSTCSVKLLSTHGLLLGFVGSIFGCVLYECSVSSSNARLRAFLSLSLHCLAAVSSSDSTALLRFIAIRLLCLVTLDLAKVWPQHTLTS